MKSFVSTCVLACLASASGFAKPVPAKEASKRIEAFAAAIRPLAESGVREVKVKPTKSVKAALLELAIKESGLDEEGFNSNWVEDPDAWEPDSSNYSETTMKAAYAHIFKLDDDYKSSLNDAGNEKAKIKIESALKKGKAAFKRLMNTGVMFGVAPFGGVQCGVQFPALAIIDPHTGKIFLFAKDGTGC